MYDVKVHAKPRNFYLSTQQKIKCKIKVVDGETIVIRGSDVNFDVFVHLCHSAIKLSSQNLVL